MSQLEYATDGLPQAFFYLEKLYGELGARQAGMDLLDRYYRGEHPMPFLTKTHEAKLSNEFYNLLGDSRSNFMRLVIDATEERLKVEGFRLSASEDSTSDQEAWRIWQASDMDEQSQVAFTEALIKGVSYVSVWNEKDGEPSTLAVEDPTQTIVCYEPGSNYQRRAAALKIWRDDFTGSEMVNVFLPTGIWKFRRRSAEDETPNPIIMPTGDETYFGPLTPNGSVRIDMAQARARWELVEDEEFVPNPWGVVPIIPLRNRPRLLVEGESEISDVYRIQNQINGFLFLLALAGYFGAHRQRWVTGLAIHEDKNGKPVEPFKTGIDTLWQTDNPNAVFGEFSQTALDGYIKAIEQKVLHIAVTTRTPRHYLIEQGQSPSGDAIKSAESGLTKKVERKQRPFGEGLEEAIRLARIMQGLEDSPPDSEVVWADAEIRTEAEITDAAIKRWQAGIITHAQALEDMGYSQVQIQRMMDAIPNPQPTAPTEPVTPEEEQ